MENPNPNDNNNPDRDNNEGGNEIFWAMCETSHFVWKGPDRHLESDADRDANEHDANNHKGERTAVVLKV